ncbi:MAG: autotransporter assembly complex family protein [Cardiobacteriaceae bacterium]|nr:autotransporter assembly complex family protein [Cardiobacteriaceae bacterium]
MLRFYPLFLLLFVTTTWADDKLLSALYGHQITEIEIRGLEEEEEENARLFLQLPLVLNETIAPPQQSGLSADYVHYLIEQGKQEIAKSLQPFGYYNSETTVNHRLNGKDLSIIYNVKAGKPTRIILSNLDVQGEALDDPEFVALIQRYPFKRGDVLNHTTYETYKSQFLELAAARGYFDGGFTENRIEVNPDTQEASISLAFSSGDRYHYDKTTFAYRDSTQEPFQESFLHRYVALKPNEPFLSDDVMVLQQDLQGSDYFSEVIVNPVLNREQKSVILDTQLSMNKRNRYVYGVGFSTDKGFIAKFDFTRRWVNERGHSFTLNTLLGQKESSFDGLYRIPGKQPQSDYYYLRMASKWAYKPSKDVRLLAEGGYHKRRGHWTHRYALVGDYGNFTIGGQKEHVTLFYPKAQWKYSSHPNELNPRSAYQVRGEIMAGGKALLSDINFAQINLSGRYLQQIDDKHRITSRLDLGHTFTKDFHKLPPSLRYYAGGDRSIRGYNFERIGHYQNGVNIGAKKNLVAGLEYEYYFKDDWAAALFVDAGDAWIENPKVKVGAGMGIHWRSPVGPIKLDIGHGFDKTYGDAYRIHLNIGTELDL